MDGATATAPRRRGTARWLLNGEGRRERGSDGPRAQWRWVAMEGVMANRGVMEGVARRRGTARPRRQIDGEGRHDGDSTMMEDEEPRERDGDVDVDTAGSGINKGQHGIKL